MLDTVFGTVNAVVFSKRCLQCLRCVIASQCCQIDASAFRRTVVWVDAVAAMINVGEFIIRRTRFVNTAKSNASRSMVFWRGELSLCISSLFFLQLRKCSSRCPRTRRLVSDKLMNPVNGNQLDYPNAIATDACSVCSLNLAGDRSEATIGCQANQAASIGNNNEL